MSRVVHFEIFGKEPENLIDFYSKVFGWKFEKWGPMNYWMIKTGEGPGIDGGLNKENNPAINTIDVDDIDKALENVKNAGGTLLTEKMTVPGVGYLAYFKDPQGNTFGLMKNNPSSK
ncbi:MAG: VOC family protein [Candidatus Aenigmatarchaeota archaeon]